MEMRTVCRVSGLVEVLRRFRGGFYWYVGFRGFVVGFGLGV